ncbi:UvrD-helicase domain-containing protein [Gordonia sp. (in: high G+C Gram-positive bacteria)]|uniref:UvrD-helicase domain-containing protein n=1 Tax=Gordonia sp. (in: high G+C Gram-positive bacteria) TaxID=84139 RepID=UPI00261AEC44|nr:UvrD-helicase domain-containing protein [Gordonia sp. (in: high G+C Gram-positive bacteria)]
MSDFDPCGELPTRTVVLEASAGTGKTYAIVSLALRYLAAGVPVERLLMATFSNAASNELRDRTRSRIAEAVAALEQPGVPGGDVVSAALRVGSPAAVALRRDRLAVALSDFDVATVATTHTFCNRMLAALGFLGERAQEYPIVENVDDLVAELARDLYLSEFAGGTGGAPSPEAVEAVAVAAVAQTRVPLVPDEDEADEAARVRVELARAARDRIAERKRLARLRTYDDLQNTLCAIVSDPGIGPAACARIREQFSVVLIDEFQDTDPEQWEIVRTCFAGHLPLVLVGDPKQSIYAFRGAEVLSYLNAVTEAGEVRRLATNWRSDQPLVDALGTLFAGAAFGDRRIAAQPVAARQETSRLHAAQPSAGPVPALRMRVFLERDFPDCEGAPSVGVLRKRVIADVADDVAATLSSGLLIDDDAAPSGRRPVEPGDIAILVRTNVTVEPLQEALAGRGVSSVVRSGTSIFKTAAARHWWYVLGAVEQPSRSTRVRLAALTPLVGLTADRLDAGGDELTGRLAAIFAELGRIFAESGFAAMAASLFERFGTEERLLAGRGGERLLTDLRQLSDLGNGRASSGSSGLASLVAWLGEQIDDSSRLRHGGAQTRRLDRDTRAVQIMTVHASKGLEFPIVYLPFGWDGAANPSPETFTFHDGGVRMLDVGGRDAPGRGRREALALTEEAGEDLRLLYVALTRARSQAVVWWGPSFPTERGPLHRLLFTAPDRARAVAAGLGPQAVPERVELPSDMETVMTLRSVAESSAAPIAVETAVRDAPVSWRRPGDGGPAPELGVATFTRRIDQEWRRTSYSAIVHDAHARVLGAEPAAAPAAAEDGFLDDEPEETDAAELVVAAESSSDGMPSLMNGLPFGAGFGTLVHEVLEHVDTSAPDLAAHVRLRTAEGAAHRGVDIDVDQLAAALLGVLTTPLGFGDLAGVPPADRLAELDFEIPLAPPGFGLDAVGDLLAEHLPCGDPLADYADLVREVSDQRFRGFLTGSIDSVLRIAGERFVIVDYKTNRLRPGELTVEDFGTAAMAAEMMAAHYPLQALLYSVALHRYLRWRLPGYRPERHLGPVQYHFVRGMAGPDTPPGCGVFEWHPPAALVVALSDLLASRRSSEVETR